MDINIYIKTIVLNYGMTFKHFKHKLTLTKMTFLHYLMIQ